MRESIPLRERRIDFLYLGFWLLNLTYITYIVDVEQLIIADPSNFEYPLWPPPFFVDMVHWWGHTYDPVLLARPPWWRATIWIDSLLFGPFYAFALYAYWKGRDWIKNPSLIWSGLMFANVTIILFEEMLGEHATPEPGIVLLANAPWLLMPLATAARVWSTYPFTRPASHAAPETRDSAEAPAAEPDATEPDAV
ncbi:MAG: emopamil-binding family protein [Acidobacteriota bacterium]